MTESPKKLYRSRVNSQISGICGGLGDYFGIDPTVIRIAFVLGFFLTGSLTFWAYLVMWIVIPEAPII
jgi:phage shock protein C